MYIFGFCFMLFIFSFEVWTDKWDNDNISRITYKKNEHEWVHCILSGKIFINISIFGLCNN